MREISRDAKIAIPGAVVGVALGHFVINPLVEGAGSSHADRAATPVEGAKSHITHAIPNSETNHSFKGPDGETYHWSAPGKEAHHPLPSYESGKGPDGHIDMLSQKITQNGPVEAYHDNRVDGGTPAPAPAPEQPDPNQK